MAQTRAIEEEQGGENTTQWSSFFEFSVPPEVPPQVLEAELKKYPRIRECVHLVSKLYQGGFVLTEKDHKLLEEFNMLFGVPVVRARFWAPCYDGIKALLDNNCKRIPPCYRAMSLSPEIARVGDVELIYKLYESDLPFDSVSTGFKDIETMEALHNLKKLAINTSTLRYVLNMGWAKGLQLIHDEGFDLEKMFAESEHAARHNDSKEESKGGHPDPIRVPGELANSLAENRFPEALDWCCKSGYKATSAAYVRAVGKQWCRSIDTVKVLIDNGVAPDRDSMSAVATLGCPDLVRGLRLMGCRMTVDDIEAFVRATSKAEYVQQVLEMFPLRDESILTTAISWLKAEVVQKLLELGFVPSQSSIEAAVRSRDTTMLLLLMEYRTPIDWHALWSDKKQMYNARDGAKQIIEAFAREPRVLGLRKRKRENGKEEGAKDEEDGVENKKDDAQDKDDGAEGEVEVEPATFSTHHLVAAYGMTGADPNVCRLSFTQ